MSIIINIVIFLAIFGYTIFTLTKFMKKSKEGKCGSCGSKEGCNTKE
ncbi:FeoB-associated Cys-rich membrane protein [Staphylococcus sp. 2S1]